MVGHYAAGALNARDLFLPPSGLYFALYGYFYVADTFRDRNGDRVDSVTIRGRTIKLDTAINLYNVSPALLWAPEWKILGANYGAFVALSVANPNLNAAIESVDRRIEIDTTTWGFGLEQALPPEPLSGQHRDLQLRSAAGPDPRAAGRHGASTVGIELQRLH